MIKSHRSRRSSSFRTSAALVAIIAALYLARSIFIPLAFAITVTLILTPVVSWLVKMHFSRGVAAVAVVLVSVASAGGIGFVILNQLIEVINEMPEYRQNIHSKIQAMRAPTKSALGKATENVRELSKELSSAQTPVLLPPQLDNSKRRITQPEPSRPVRVEIVKEPANELQYIRDLAWPFLAPLSTLGIVLIFAIFLLIEQNDLLDRLFRLAGMSQLNLMTRALEDATSRVGRYLMLQFLVNSAFGLLCGLGLYFLGVPYAALWGTVAAILRIVPYIGSAIAGLLPLLLSLAVFDKWMPPLLVFLMFASLELVTGNFIEPWLYGAHTGISSLALLLTTVFWTTLWGPAGLILSTPLTVCLVVLGRHVQQFSYLHILLGDKPVLAVEAQFYQRLLSMDEQGVRDIVEHQLRENSVLQLYDSVLVPTLTLAERDRHRGALDPDREEFIFASMREVLSDLAGRPQRPEGCSDGSVIPNRNGPNQNGPNRNGRILCIPANDESDEIAAAMLAQLLGGAGLVAVSLPIEATLQRAIRMVAPKGDDVICISALPPFAFERARTLSIRLRRQFPTTRLMVGIWGFTGDASRAVKRFQPHEPDRVVTSLASALEWLENDRARTSTERDPQNPAKTTNSLS